MLRSNRKLVLWEWDTFIYTYSRLHLQIFRDTQNEMVKLLRTRPNVPPLFSGSYNFKRHNVVQLSQLVARYLESKPNEINANRIYSCVEVCYRDLKRGWSDNPDHYYMDVRMLLATAMRLQTAFMERKRVRLPAMQE